MSPEYQSWRDFRKNDEVGKEIKTAVEAVLEVKSLKERRKLIHSGFAFVVSGEDISKFVNSISALTPSQRKDALKKTSSWHLVLGVNESERTIKLRERRAREFAPISTENAVLLKGGHRNLRKYRGKHRSETKGPGLRALLRGTHSKGR